MLYLQINNLVVYDREEDGEEERHDSGKDEELHRRLRSGARARAAAHPMRDLFFWHDRARRGELVYKCFWKNHSII